MSKQYTLTKQIHELLPQINQKYGLEIEVESDYTWHEYSGYIDSQPLTEYRKYNKKEYCHSINRDPLNCDLVADCSVIISPPLFLDTAESQIRQILVGLEDVLGKLPWKIKEIGDGFVAEIQEGERRFLFEKHTDPFSGSIKRRFILNCQNSNAILYKRVFKEKKDLELELKKYLLDTGDQYSAEALCNRWLDGLDPLFDREPETVLKELIQILENLLK